MEYYFKTEKLSVGYNGKPLIQNIDIGIGKGQILTTEWCGKVYYIKKHCETIVSD